MERGFKMKQKLFFIIFKGLSLKQIKYIFLGGEIRTLIPNAPKFTIYHTHAIFSITFKSIIHCKILKLCLTILVF